MIKIARITLMSLLSIFFGYGFVLAEFNIEMAYVKGGCFKMGTDSESVRQNEKPAHEVCLSDFKIGIHEVTQAQWKAVLDGNPSIFPGDRRPVDNVTWEGAQEFIKKLNLKTGKRYRLPTEAEWEYAARSGGRPEKWPGTNGREQLGNYSWYNANSREETHDVGTLQPNGLGIYDMGGNVWEWVQDWYDDSWYKESPKDNPQGPKNGTVHVCRGGSWNDSPNSFTATRRKGDELPKQGIIGFRLAHPTTDM